MSGPETSRVRLNKEGWDAICTIAALDYRVSGRELMEALMNFAISQHQRPGSWEAQGFDFANYRDGGFADQWFEPVKPRNL